MNDSLELSDAEFLRWADIHPQRWTSLPNERREAWLDHLTARVKSTTDPEERNAYWRVAYVIASAGTLDQADRAPHVKTCRERTMTGRQSPPRSERARAHRPASPGASGNRRAAPESGRRAARMPSAPARARGRGLSQHPHLADELVAVSHPACRCRSPARPARPVRSTASASAAEAQAVTSAPRSERMCQSTSRASRSSSTTRTLIPLRLTRAWEVVSPMALADGDPHRPLHRQPAAAA